MALTPRRREALSALRRAADEKGDAVHYSLVAAVMRISSWTAYDLLRELEALGLVQRLYRREGKRAGRSRALFLPRFAPAAVAAVDEGLRVAFERFAAMGDDAAAARAYVAEPVPDLGYHLAFWLSRISASGGQATQAAQAVLEGGGEAATKMQTVVWLGLGTALGRLRTSQLAARVAAGAAACGRLLEEATASSDERLEPLLAAARDLFATSPERRRFAL